MSLNRGISMTTKSKGIKRTAPQRVRMPWTESKEFFPYAILSRKDGAILDGKPAFASSSSLARSSMLEPLDGLKAVVAQYEYNTSTGRTLFQLANHVKYLGRGQRFFRKEWQEGTYDKYVTLASVYFDRCGSTGQAYGYTSFHGESSLFPVQIDNANLPGWHMFDFKEALAVPLDDIVKPPPSEGTEVECDLKRYRLKSYPFYDAPNPPEFVNRLLKERGVLPDMGEGGGDGEGGGGGRNSELGDVSVQDGSSHHQEKK